MVERLPRPRALERELGRVEDVGALERGRRGGGPGRARLELRVDVVDLDRLVARLDRRRDVAAVLEVVVVADLVRRVAAVSVVVDLHREAVAAVELRHELHARGLRLDDPRRLDVDVLVGDLDVALGGDLLQAVGLVVLGRERRALRVRGELDIGVLGRKIVGDLVRDRDVVGLGRLDEVAGERDLVDEVLVRVVVVVSGELGREVAKLERLYRIKIIKREKGCERVSVSMPECVGRRGARGLGRGAHSHLVPRRLDVVEGGAAADVGRGDLSRVREREAAGRAHDAAQWGKGESQRFFES